MCGLVASQEPSLTAKQTRVIAGTSGGGVAVEGKIVDTLALLLLVDRC